MELPDLPPYAPENQDLPTPPEGQVLHKMPFDRKYIHDPFWYDTLGRTMIEQRKILTLPRSDEEQVTMVEQALRDCEDVSDENTEEEDRDNEEEQAAKMDKRIQSIAVEAAMKGSAVVMKHLVEERGLHTNNHPDGLWMEAHIASRNGFIGVLEVLLDQAGVAVDVKDEDKAATPLYMAAFGGQLETVKWLLDRGARHAPVAQNRGYIFGAAAHNGDVEIMEALLAAARDREPETLASTWVTEGRVLAYAAMSASAAMVQLVVESGGYRKAAENTEGQRKDGIVAIPLAIKNDRTDQTCLDLAIECAFPKNDDGSFAKNDDSFVIDQLSSAAANCCSRVKPAILGQILQLILDVTTMAADSAAFKSVLNSALHYCMPPRAEPCARVLLEEWHASPNINDAEYGRVAYPLMLAHGGVESQDIEYLRFWLDHGADIHRAWGLYCNGPTALARAIEMQEVAAVRLLLEYGGPADQIEPGLVGKKEIWVTVAKDELQGVEIVGSGGNDDSVTKVSLPFEDGVSENWLGGVQLRRPDVELAKDGSGRGLKSRQ